MCELPVIMSQINKYLWEKPEQPENLKIRKEFLSTGVLVGILFIRHNFGPI
jgi:hypothetical protein